jgi:uncharacterized protein
MDLMVASANLASAVAAAAGGAVSDAGAHVSFKSSNRGTRQERVEVAKLTKMILCTVGIRGAAAAFITALLIGQSAIPAAAANPSFSCTGNLAPTEAVICSDDSLAALDRTLADAYKRMYASFPSSERGTLASVQRTWLAQRNACRTDKNCIHNAYLTRLRQLGGASQQPAQMSCTASVGAQQAAVYVKQCSEVSPATHPPCNATNACALIISEIRRGCAMIGSAAPAFCAAYK